MKHMTVSLALALVCSCGATCGVGSSPVWHSERVPGPFCAAAEHSLEVQFHTAPRGGLLRFVARPGEREELLTILQELAPALMTRLQPVKLDTPNLEKWAEDSLKAHGAGHGGGTAGGATTAPAGGVSGGESYGGASSGQTRPVAVDARAHHVGAELLVVATNRGDTEDLRVELRAHVQAIAQGGCDRTPAP